MWLPRSEKEGYECNEDVFPQRKLDWKALSSGWGKTHRVSESMGDAEMG